MGVELFHYFFIGLIFAVAIILVGLLFSKDSMQFMKNMKIFGICWILFIFILLIIARTPTIN